MSWRWGLLLWAWLMAPLHAASVTWGPAHWCVHPALVAATPCHHWRPLTLPLAYSPARPLNETIVLRLPFSIAKVPEEPLGLYIPYLHHGARVRLNGQMLVHLPGATGEREVRWERPVLWQVTPALLKPGRNELRLEMHPGRDLHVVRMAHVEMGDWMALDNKRNAREFLVQGLPQLTVLMCGFIAVFLSMIWLMQPRETLYALLAATLALWGLRTSTFLVESLSHDGWLWWRSTYHWATGGFIVMLSIFASQFARPVGTRTPLWPWAAVLWWFAGPSVLLIGGVTWERAISAYWTLGLAFIGLNGLFQFLRPIRQGGSATAWWMSGAALVAFLAGVHDLLMANWPQGLRWLGQGWLDRRFFLLHHAANLMLLCLAAVMTRRFVETLQALSAMNQTLEDKVRERERALDLVFKEKAQLMVAHATEEERQRMVVDMHDGLGSRLFTTLTRVERGAASADETSRALRACIDDMRLMIDALSPGAQDLSVAFASFRHRWDDNLQALQLQTRWDVPEQILGLQPGARQVMQILQVLQEALTNVVKHAHASEVGVAGWLSPGGEVVFEVMDNGRGIQTRDSPGGRGTLNMKRRAERLGGHLRVESGSLGTRVQLVLPGWAKAHGWSASLG